jgi:DNA-binding winged helix-turn-helix (wHTH) protein
MQSAVKIGFMAMDAAHPDFCKFRFLSVLLGGYFGSRLMSNVREENGYTYHIAAELDAYGHRNAFMISSEAATEYVEPMIKEVYAELERLVNEPVDEEEMILRIAALLRRSKIVNEHKLTVGQTVLDYDALAISTPSGVLELPKKEFMLLFKLLSYPNKIFTRRQLMDEVWDMDSDTDERTVDVHINRLRDRFRGNCDFEIVTVRGLGYKAVKRA